MNYIEIHFKVKPHQQEVLIAFLDIKGFEGFQVTKTGLTAYMTESLFNKKVLSDILNINALSGIKYHVNVIEEQNWNTIWESNFQPVYIDNFCYIRAPFHEPDTKVDYEIVIEPKMSFGTGHHETTRLMIEFMRDIPVKKKKVLDMGCGTGILSILAAKMDAALVTAVDIDKWAYSNATENARKNNIGSIQFIQGDIDAVRQNKYDVILANINRNILMLYIKHYARMLTTSGFLIISGILIQDLDYFLEKSSAEGLRLINKRDMENWLSLLFVQNN